MSVEFTQLETGHLPARENRESEIKQYKKKYANDKLLADSADVSDRQPAFLKDKGDTLFRWGPATRIPCHMRPSSTYHSPSTKCFEIGI